MSFESAQPTSDRGHPIAVVAERTGLSPDVLRIWERRYQAVAPTRTAGGERLYTDADVERLRLLDAAVAAGRRIGRVAGLSTAELARLVDEDRASEATRANAQAYVRSEGDRTVIDAALARIRALDARGLDELLRRRAAVVGAPALIEKAIVPLLRQIGDDWHAGRLSIAQEHVASAVIEAFVMATTRAMAVSDDAPSLVVGTLAGSRHVIAAALVGAAAAAEGWKVLFLGGDLPANEMARAAIAANARAVAVSVVYSATPADMLGELRRLREQLPAEVVLLAGGRAVLADARAVRRSGIEVGETIDAVRTVLRGIANDGSLGASS